MRLQLIRFGMIAGLALDGLTLAWLWHRWDGQPLSHPWGQAAVGTGLVVAVLAIAGWFIAPIEHRHIEQARRGFEVKMRRRGFSFVEVLLAIIVLAVGMSLIAAMFPVAIKQNQLTHEEIRGTQTIHNAIPILSTLAVEDNFRPTAHPTPRGDFPDWETPPQEPGQWLPIPLEVGSKIAGELISSSDNRYAWVAYYRRSVTRQLIYQADENGRFIKDDPSRPPAAQYKNTSTIDVLVLAMSRRSKSFSSDDLTYTATPITVSLFPKNESSSSNTSPMLIDSSTDFLPGDMIRLTSTGRVYRVWHEDGTKWALFPGAGYRGTDFHPSGIADAELLQPARLYPTVAFARLAEGGPKPDQIEFIDPLTGIAKTMTQLNAGAYIVIGNDGQYGAAGNYRCVATTGKSHGLIVRLGKDISATTRKSRFELQPGHDLQNDTSNLTYTTNAPDWDNGEDLPAIVWYIGDKEVAPDILVYRATLPLRLH